MTAATSPARMMRAAQYQHYGPPGVLQVHTVPVPKVPAGHVLVRVAATSVNAADVAIRSGKLRHLTGRRFPRGTGFDFAGRVVAVADDVQTRHVGEAVWGFLNGIRQGPTAAAAEYLVVPPEALATAPHSVDVVAAAALAGAGGSALAVLRDAAKLRPDERILIRGGGGGVGTAAVQLARAMGGLVTALARTEHHDALRSLGAEATFDYRTVRPVELGRFDVVVDTVGSALASYRRLLTGDGRYANMALGAPRDLVYMATSVVFGSRRVRFVQAPPNGMLLADLATYVDQGAVTPVIAGRYRLEEIDAAHRAMHVGGRLGKHVIEIAVPET